MASLDSVQPPDDTGTDTFQRYRYQAKIAFQYVVRMVAQGDISAIYVEHVEDLVVIWPDEAEFIQVKTRDASRPNWSDSDLLDGPLESLWRTAAAVGTEGTLSLLLEGSFSDRSMLGRWLRTRDPQHFDEARDLVAKKFQVGSEEAGTFLARVQRSSGRHHRDAIDGMNIQLLIDQAETSSGKDIRRIYQSSLATIEAAMANEGGPHGWKNALAAYGAQGLPGLGKRLTADNFSDSLGLVVSKSGARRLVRRLTDASVDGGTILEAKLLAGGATEHVIRDAKQYRAMASMKDPLLLDSVAEEDGAEFLRRLETRYNALRGCFAGEARPAAKIWNGLFEMTEFQWKQIDFQDLYGGDTFAMIGKLCDLADQCLVDFGGGEISE